MTGLSHPGCGGAAELRQEVLDPGLCAACGACVGYCPYIKTFGEQVALVHPCGICSGACYRVCPRVVTDYPGIRQRLFAGTGFDPVLGTHLSVTFARAIDVEIRSRGQYGGVVSALSRQAFRQGLIDCALMAGGGPAGAKPALCSSPEEMIGAAGSKYTAVPTLSLYQEAVGKGFQRIGVVGRPCQVTAARKMEAVEDIRGDRIALVVGLFCFWSLSGEFYSFLREKGLESCSRMDIPKDGVRFQLAGAGEVNLPLEELRPLIKASCHSCYDPLSELADVSVGSTEHDPGWNTLLVRTQKGRQLLEEAVAAGVLELKPYPGELLPVLRRAVFLKKKRVLESTSAPTVGVPPGEKEFFLKGVEGQ